jgi:hypothetical protein
VAELGGCVDELQAVQGLDNSTQTSAVRKRWQLPILPIYTHLQQQMPDWVCPGPTMLDAHSALAHSPPLHRALDTSRA